jgi:hypothetical protein
VTPLYSALDATDAQLLGDRLESAGIEFVIRNLHLQGAVGELPASIRPEVCIVRPRDMARAEEVKAEFERNRRDPLVGPERRCLACGEMSPPNFELCWSCRAPFPE